MEKKNQIVALGKHRLLQGDATKEQDVDTLVGKERVSLILTDPPYGVSYVESKKDFVKNEHRRIANDDISSDDRYRAFTADWLCAVTPCLARKNACYIFNSDKMIFALREAMLESKYKFGQLLVWVKTQSVLGRLDYLPQHELIAYGWYGQHRFFKSKDKSIIICPRTAKNDLHPTMKPISLLRRLILNSTEVGDWVYDPFGGSGSTLVACEQTGRRCLMMEIDGEYCKTIVERYQALGRLTKIKNHEKRSKAAGN